MKDITLVQLANRNGNNANNQIVATIKDENGLTTAYIFVSYGYDIAKIDCNKRSVILTQKWDYSNATRKHLYIFLRNYGRLPIYSRKDVLKEIENGSFTIVESIER